jgi:hypothetical protein
VKNLARILGGIVGTFLVLAIVLIGLARAFSFDPGITHPGLWVSGEVVTEPVTDWSFAKKVRGSTVVETRDRLVPGLAFSVTTARFVHNGRLYVGSGYPAGKTMPAGRHWNKNIIADPVVRIKIGGKVYPGKLVYVSDPQEHDDIARANGMNLWAPGFYIHLWRVEPLNS